MAPPPRLCPAVVRGAGRAGRLRWLAHRFLGRSDTGNELPVSHVLLNQWRLFQPTSAAPFRSSRVLGTCYHLVTCCCWPGNHPCRPASVGAHGVDGVRDQVGCGRAVQAEDRCAFGDRQPTPHAIRLLHDERVMAACLDHWTVRADRLGAAVTVVLREATFMLGMKEHRAVDVATRRIDLPVPQGGDGARQTAYVDHGDPLPVSEHVAQVGPRMSGTICGLELGVRSTTNTRAERTMTVHPCGALCTGAAGDQGGGASRMSTALNTIKPCPPGTGVGTADSRIVAQAMRGGKMTVHLSHSR